MTTIAMQWIFKLNRTGPDDALLKHSQEVMEQLLKQEMCSAVRDSAVSLDTLEDLITIELSSVGDSYEDAVALGMSAIRSAIHAANGATPDWPSHDELMSPEPLQMNTSPA